MNKYRSAALALAACAAAGPVAACSAGVSVAGSAASSATTNSATTNSATTNSATTNSAAASSHGASSGASSPGAAVSASTVTVGGSIGSFPVPAGANVAENVSEGKNVIIFFGRVTPAKVASFYTTALPRAGYAITSNDVIGVSGGTEAEIVFSGHGYKGEIVALSNFSETSVNIAGLGHKNVTNISLQPA